MGAHSTFEQALAGVTAFATAARSDSDNSDLKRRSRKKAKVSDKQHGEKKVKRNKKKSRTKHKESRKKNSKRKRSDSSEEESSESQAESLEAQLARGKAVTRSTRELVAHRPDARRSFRQMFWRLDNGEAVNIGSIPDVGLRALLQQLFELLRLPRSGEAVYVRRRNSEPILRQIGHVLEEAPAAPSNSLLANFERRTAAADPVPSASPSMPGNEGAQSLEEERADSQSETARGAAQPTAAVIGPALPQDGAALTPQDEQKTEVQATPDSEEPKRRLVGPALPPQALLDQAAEVAEALAVEEEALQAAALIGPPPPALVEQDQEVAGDERSAEVQRIARILEAASQLARNPDPYKIIDMDAEAEMGAIRKRYWRLSLMIHPDKCNHPNAQDAFDAVSQAAKALQDMGQRERIDKEREKAEFEAFAEEELQKQERARQWRVARGQATADDLQGPAAARPQGREEWLTALPAARRPSAPSQKSQKAFSQQGVAAVGQDASLWADSPTDKLLRLQQAGTAMLTSAQEPQEKAAKAAKAVDAYNKSNRSKTLLDQHLDQQRQGRKQKVAKASQDADQSEAWVGSHPWRPFDREKDLQASGKPASQAEFVKQMGDLSSRFGGSDTAPRRFL